VGAKEVEGPQPWGAERRRPWRPRRRQRSIEPYRSENDGAVACSETRGRWRSVARGQSGGGGSPVAEVARQAVALCSAPAAGFRNRRREVKRGLRRGRERTWTRSCPGAGAPTGRPATARGRRCGASTQRARPRDWATTHGSSGASGMHPVHWTAGARARACASAS
jgi:hypothetical protein